MPKSATDKKRQPVIAAKYMPQPPKAKAPVIEGVEAVKAKKISPILLIGLACLGIFSLVLAAVFLRQSQDVRQEAAAEQNVLLGLASRSQDDKLIIDVTLNSRTYNIAGIEVLGRLAGTEKENVVVNTSNQINLTPVSTIVESYQNETTFEVRSFAPLDPNSTSNTRDTAPTVISFSISNPPSSGITVSFDERTKVPTLDPVGVALTLPAQQTFYFSGVGGQSPSPTPSSSPDSDASKKTCNQNCATDTECQSAYKCYKGQCRLKDTPDDAACTAIQDRGLNRGCNQYCADSNECQDQYTCYFNQCRNPKNLTSTSCETPKASPKTTTSSGTGGTTKSSPKASVKPSATPKLVATARLVSPTPSVRPSASATARPATASASPSPFTSQKPVVRGASPSPIAIQQPAKRDNSRLIIGVIATVLGLGILGFAAYKLLAQ